MAHGFQMTGKGMKQWSCLLGAPEVFSKFSGELDQSPSDHQANGLAYLHILEMVCMPNFWKRGEGIVLSFLVLIFSLCLGLPWAGGHSCDF